MPQCDNGVDDIDVETDVHFTRVKPMEFKGQIQEVTQYYCSVACLVENVGE